MNLRRFLFLSLWGALFASMTACKKGENDPFFSFKSRNARLKGTWKLVGKEAVLGNSVLVGQAPPVNYYVASTYDGTKEIMTITSNNITTKMVYYDSEITFSEKGDLSYSLFIYFLSDTLNQVFKTAAFQGTGTWVWNDMDKNKLGLQLIPDHLPIVPDTLNMGTLFPFELAGNYYLDRLSNKELWMKRSGTRTTQIDSIVTTTSFEIKWSFQKK